MKHYDKARYMHEINEMMERCNDITLLDLVWRILCKMIRKEGEA